MTFFLFILILSILVLVHETGHYLAAKKAGIKVEEFAFGLPFTKPLFSRKRGETVYSIYPLIFGGFVKLYGEDGIVQDDRMTGSSEQSKKRAYFEKSIPQRTLVLLAGVFMNLILAIVCFSILYFVWGIPTKTGKVVVEAVAENSPAQAAEVKPNDWIVAVNGEAINEGDQLIRLTQEKTGQKIQLEISRGIDNPCKLSTDNVLGGMATAEFGFNCKGENLLVSIIPRKDPPQGEGPLGVVVTDGEFKKYPFYLMPFLGVKEGFKESLNWGKMILSSLGQMIYGLVTKGKIPEGIAGPVGIYQITGQAVKAGWLAVLQLLGIISVNLAIVNVLPIPAMDGGRLVFLGYELLFRKKAPVKIEAAVNSIGMIVLLGLMALITVNDLLRLAGR